MSHGSSIDLGEDLEKEKKLKIKELDPDELTRKEAKALEKKNKKSRQNPSDKLRFKKYGGKGPINEIANFIEKYHIVILLLICLISGFVVLSQPAFLKGIEDNIEKNILTNLQKQINLKIDLDYPRLSKGERIKLAKEYFEKAKKEQVVQSQITVEAKKWQDYYKDDSGHPYVYGVDSYLFLTEARNLLEIGMAGDKIKLSNGDLVLINSLREAPRGTGPINSFISYLEYYSFKVAKLFGWSLEKTAFFLPLLFGLFSITTVFFIAKKITNPIGGFFSAFIFSIHQRFFAQNYAGFADTNYLNMFFSLLLILLFLHFLDFKFKKSFFCILTVIPITLIFRWTWRGYLFIYAVIFLFLFLQLIFYLVKNIQKKKNQRFLVILFFTLILIGIRSTKIPKINSTYHLIKSRIAPSTMETDLFRTGMDNIIELKSASFETIFNAMGRYFFWILFVLALGYIIYCCIKHVQKKYYIFLLVWFALTFIAGICSRRFLFYTAPPFSIIIGMGLSLILPILVAFTDISQLNIKERVWKVIILAILIFLIALSVKGDVIQLKEYHPLMNDAIYDTANFIRLNSDENTIINTWWDLGYMYQYYARRGTIFDPGAFGGSRQYWLSRAFLNKIPEIAKTIWQMQNCENETNNQNEDSTFSDIKQLIICNNSGFVVVSEDMLGKIYEMKASATKRKLVKIASEAKRTPKARFISKLISQFNLTKAEAETRYKELINFKDTAEPIKISRISSCTKNSEAILCDNGYQIKNNEVTYKGKHPAAFYSYLGDNSFKANYSDSKADFAFILYETGKGIYSFMIQSDLAETMIIRMFAGDKIKGFEEVYSTEHPMQIRTYKILQD